MREVKPHSPTGDGWYDLVAYVYKQAIQDARRGNFDAIDFLSTTAPELNWRRKEKKHDVQRVRRN